MYGLDPCKYPTRLGQPWKEDEVVKLLTSIQKKKSVEEIAKEHDRTVGGINAYIRKLAVDYHMNDNRTMEEIQKYTGLTKEQIEDAIKKNKSKAAIKKSSETTEHKVEKKENRRGNSHYDGSRVSSQRYSEQTYYVNREGFLMQIVFFRPSVEGPRFYADCKI